MGWAVDFAKVYCLFYPFSCAIWEGHLVGDRKVWDSARTVCVYISMYTYIGTQNMLDIRGVVSIVQLSSLFSMLCYMHLYARFFIVTILMFGYGLDLLSSPQPFSNGPFPSKDWWLGGETCFRQIGISLSKNPFPTRFLC